jgi:hypothetical protein
VEGEPSAVTFDEGFISVCLTTKVRTKHASSAAIGNISIENVRSLRHDTL